MVKHRYYKLFYFTRWIGLRHTYTFTNYCSIIEILYEEHKKHSGKWLANLSGDYYNLKKKQVRHVCSHEPEDIDNFIDKSFLDYIDSYKTNLTDLYANIVYRINKETGIVLTGRIKNDDSILLKLHRKRFEDGGKFPLNKYLNDLLGFRIIDEGLNLKVNQIKDYLNSLKEQKWRIMHKYRKNGEYKGYHIYFMGPNSRSFPIELQLWDVENERDNLTSHEQYKKSYTYWPKIYREGE